MTSRSNQLQRTTDLAMATYLIMQGHTASMEQVSEAIGQERPNHPQGAWVFDATPELAEQVEAFNEGEARVEPSAFQAQLNTTRRAMFKFLGMGQ